MSAKHNFCFYVIVFLFLLSCPLAAMAVTINELTGICEAMESAIVDISLEYEWYCDSPLTLEEELEYIAEKGLLLDIGHPTYKFSAARSLSGRGLNDPNSPVFDRLFLEMSTTLMNKDENVWDIVTKTSYNGKVTKELSIGGFPRSVTNGMISSGLYLMHPINLTPIGFSILRFGHKRP